MSVALFNNLTVLTPSDKLSALAATTSAELAGVISDETGSGALVFGTSPTFTTQITVPKIVATSNALDIQPTTDATTAIQLNDKDGNAILNVDTTNDRVGIGTTGPAARLETKGSGYTYAGIGNGTTRISGTGTGQILEMAIDANTLNASWIQSSAHGGADGLLLNPYGGNVGIGTTDPGAYKLHVDGGMIAQTYTTGDILFRATDEGPDIWRLFEDSTSLYTQSLTTGQTVLTIKDNGNVGIGTITPGAKLEINGSGNHLKFTGNTTDAGMFLSVSTLYIADWATGAKGLLINVSSGNVGIGAAAPTGGGTPALALAQASANPINIGINTAGLIAKDNGGTCELYAWDEAGNVTQISPHSAGLLDDLPLSYELPFVFHSENKYLGRAICVDMFGALRAVEQLSGKKFITLEDVPQGNWEDDARDAAARFNRDELQKLMARQVEVPKEHALERVEITEEIPTEETEQTGKWLIDSDGAVITETRHKTIKRATGRYHWQPRTGIHFDAANGKFYRTLTETEAAEIFTPQEPKPCPKWIASRLEAK
jgi:hypothetical protein